MNQIQYAKYRHIERRRSRFPTASRLNKYGNKIQHFAYNIFYLTKATQSNFYIYIFVSPSALSKRLCSTRKTSGLHSGSSTRGRMRKCVRGALKCALARGSLYTFSVKIVKAVLLHVLPCYLCFV